MNTTGQLPPELISSILHHVDKTDLYACTLINKPFYNEAMPLLWHHIHVPSHFRSHDHLLKLTITMATSSHMPSLHIRHLSIACRLSDRQLGSLIKHVPFLDQLHLSNASDITDLSFQHVPSRCPRLTTLHLRYAKCTLLSMDNLGKCCHWLDTLILDELPHLDYTKLFSVLAACPLASVTLKPPSTTTIRVSSNTSSSLAKAAASGLQHQQQHLAALTIDNYEYDYSAFINTASVRGFVWPHLTHLHLGACHSLTDTPTIQFLQAHPQLLHLNLSYTKLTDKTLDAIPTALPVLHHLTIQFSPQLTGAGICRLVKHCAHLDEGVDCYGCDIFWQDDDFPHEALHGLYERDIMNGGGEVIWVSGHAFDPEQRSTTLKAYHRWDPRGGGATKI